MASLTSKDKIDFGVDQGRCSHIKRGQMPTDKPLHP